jgi:DNA-binding Lrp family transcriptional regulator
MKQILEALEKDARLTPDKISAMTGIPVEEVTEKIKKAEKEHIILKYKAVVNWNKFGDEKVWAVVEVKVVPQRDVGFDAIAKRIYRFPQVHSVYLASGTYDFAIIVLGSTIQEIAVFVSEKLAPIDEVQGTVTHFILKKYKEDGEIFEDGEGDKRLPFLP